MTTTGQQFIPFICKLAMEDEIACDHTVKLTAPGLNIGDGGGYANELIYVFLAGEGLIEKDISVEGEMVGRFKIYADITSPYFVIAGGGLKIKKDEIAITITPAPSGIYGTYTGVNLNGTQAGSVDPNLFIKHVSSGGGEFLTGTNNSDGLAFSAIITRPDGTTVFKGFSTASAQIQCTQVGEYRVQFFDSQIVDSSAGTLPNRTFAYFDSSVSVVVPVATKTVKRRGTKFTPVSIIGVGAGPFSGSIPLVDTWHPYGSVSATAVGSPPSCITGASVSVNIAAAGSASGTWVTSSGGSLSITVTKPTGGTFFMVVNQG